MIDNAGTINMAKFCFDEASEGPESLLRKPSVTPDKFLTSAMTIESGSSTNSVESSLSQTGYNCEIDLFVRIT